MDFLNFISVILYIDLAIIYIVQWRHHRERLVEIKSLLQYNKEIIQLDILNDDKYRNIF